MRRARGYPSDLTDAQWQVIAGHLPAEVPGPRGRPRVWPLRQIVEAILYVDRAGCAWRYLPDSFPPWPTVYGYFAAWRDDGTLARLHDVLRAQVRAAAGRDPEPTTPGVNEPAGSCRGTDSRVGHAPASDCGTPPPAPGWPGPRWPSVPAAAARRRPAAARRPRPTPRTRSPPARSSWAGRWRPSSPPPPRGPRTTRPGAQPAPRTRPGSTSPLRTSAPTGPDRLQRACQERRKRQSHPRRQNLHRACATGQATCQRMPHTGSGTYIRLRRESRSRLQFRYSQPAAAAIRAGRGSSRGIKRAQRRRANNRMICP